MGFFCVDLVGCQNRSEWNQLKFSLKWNQSQTFGSVFFKVMFRCSLNNHIDLPTICIPLSTGSIWTSEGCNENGSFRRASGNTGARSTTVVAPTPKLLVWILLPVRPQEIVEFKARGNCAPLFGVYCHTGVADTFLSGWVFFPAFVYKNDKSSSVKDADRSCRAPAAKLKQST